MRATAGALTSAAGSAAPPRFVVFAYECAPGGSEHGTGWGFARLAARLGETWVLVEDEESQVEALRRALSTSPERPRLHIVPVQVPRWTRTVRRVDVVPGHMYPAYALWQVRAVRLARRLHRAQHFTVAWHVAWSNAWFGTLAACLDIPFVYGPLAGGVGAPWRLVADIGPAGAMREVIRAAARWYGRHLNPLARLALHRACVILVQNPETIVWLPSRDRGKAVIVPAPVLSPIEPRTDAARHLPPTALFVGRLQGWKGVGLAIRALLHLPGWRLLVCGEGRDRTWLERVAARLGLSDRVRFVGRVPRDRVLDLMRHETDVLLFPSYHDEGGWVVSEAIACGVPVVCLDRGGPAALGGHAVQPSGPATTARRLADMAQRVAGHQERGPVPDFDRQLARIGGILTDHGLISRLPDPR